MCINAKLFLGHEQWNKVKQLTQVKEKSTTGQGNLSSVQNGGISPGLYILGPPVYNVHEGMELALICTDEGGGSMDKMVWRRKVIMLK